MISGPDERAPGTPTMDAPATIEPEQGVELPRYGLLQATSIALMIVGGAAVASVLLTTTGILTGDVLRPGTASQAAAALIVLLLGAVALVLGLAMSAVRSIVVREALPPQRYRGPSIIVLWLLATVATNLAVVPVAGDLAELLAGGEPSIYGTLVTLTVTQAGLVAAAALLVYAPRALAGLRLLPSRGLLASLAIGLGLAIPSWIGAQLVGYLTIRLLEPFGLQPEPGIADAALTAADPAVLVVTLVVVAPIAEELFFRGVVYNAWEREYGATRAIYGSAVLFAAIHGSVFAIPSIFALGVVLALLFRATRSLPATILLHAGFNALTVLVTLLVRFGVVDIPIT